MRSLDRESLRRLVFVLLLSVTAIAVAVGGVASGSTSSQSLIEIHEQGTSLITDQMSPVLCTGSSPSN
jgi:hypothetical protein